jgi:diketogulonate reductase-like aldo/keto reductase
VIWWLCRGSDTCSHAHVTAPQVDLLLIHHPNSPTCNSTDQISLTWEAMQGALAQGLTRSIGVSNFKTSDLTALAAAPTTKITPAVNQILLHVGVVDTVTIAYCEERGIVVMAYSPLGHPDGGGQPVYELPAVLKIATAHNVTGAQVALKWSVQHGYPYVTASPTLEYDREDLDLFRFNLTAAEMATLDAIHE